MNVNKMQETAKTLQPANDLPGVRVQIASMKVIETINTFDAISVVQLDGIRYRYY